VTHWIDRFGDLNAVASSPASCWGRSSREVTFSVVSGGAVDLVSLDIPKTPLTDAMISATEQ